MTEILLTVTLTFTALLAVSWDVKLMIFFCFSQKIFFDISCKSSSWNVEVRFLGKNKKRKKKAISKCYLMK